METRPRVAFQKKLKEPRYPRLWFKYNMIIGNIKFHFIPSSEHIAYLNQIKVVLSTVKKYRIFSLVANTIYSFSL